MSELLLQSWLELISLAASSASFFTEKAVPIVAHMYLIGGVVVLIMNVDAILPAIKMIFTGL